jgi:orotate phosphoribosyltransferase/orotidine 5'-phosphate decarboxylase subfamily 1
MEDRKFADIGNTVHLQSEPICKYADLITVHAISGPGIIDGLRENCQKHKCAVLLLAQMSTQNNLLDQTYTSKVVDIACENKDVVVGFISTENLNEQFLHFTPGVKLPKKGSDEPHKSMICLDQGQDQGQDQDWIDQSYRSPQYLIEEADVEYLIVGRGIYEAECPVEEAKKYVYTKRHSLIRRIVESPCEIVKYGNFTLKSGAESNIYVDMRMLMGDPALMRDLIHSLICLDLSEYDADHCIAGCPMGALPLATTYSQHMEKPQIMVRDKPKSHGCGKMIEGPIPDSKQCLIIEDVITSGGSVLEFAQRIESQGLEVLKILALLDREQGGVEMLREKGYQVLTLFKLSDFTQSV